MATAPPEKAPKPGLNIYGTAAVNPYKLTIAAEELGYDPPAFDSLVVGGLTAYQYPLQLHILGHGQGRASV